jgi:hypothetical protein
MYIPANQIKVAVESVISLANSILSNNQAKAQHFYQLCFVQNSGDTKKETLLLRQHCQHQHRDITSTTSSHIPLLQDVISTFDQGQSCRCTPRRIRSWRSRRWKGDCARGLTSVRDRRSWKWLLKVFNPLPFYLSYMES